MAVDPRNLIAQGSPLSSFRLIYRDHELALPLPFDLDAEDLLVAKISNAAEGSPQQKDLSRRIVDAVTAQIEDGGVVRPSTSQIKYAVGIATELGLELSPEVLRSREKMGDFLNRHAAEYRRLKSTSRRQTGAQ